MLSLPSSAATGVFWPALPNTRDALVLSLQYQFEQSQWWTAAQLEVMQLRQLTALALYAAQTTAFYRDRLPLSATAPKQPLSLAQWQSVPLLTRQDIQDQRDALAAHPLPQGHSPTQERFTSGSTGSPLSFLATPVTGLFYQAFNLRNFIWHGYRFEGKCAVIRLTHGQQADPRAGWVPAHRSGPLVKLDINTPVKQQLTWLQEHNPHYLVTYPSNLKALLQQAAADGVDLPQLALASTLGEIVDPDLRALCQQIWQARLVDAYSCMETGAVALQCPTGTHYHIQSENVFVEVLDEAGQPCSAGQSGRVVLTDLHNYAMPIIRYAVGDYAEVGRPCACGRGLPVLSRILGRRRNMFTLPSGDRRWPNLDIAQWGQFATIRQAQVVQHAPEDFEVKLVTDAPLHEGQSRGLHDFIAARIGYPVTLRLNRVDEIPLSAGGKREDFVSLV